MEDAQCDCSRKSQVGQKHPVLDHGYIILRDVFGSDLEIVNAARISYHEDSNRKSSDDKALLDYLIRHRHTSPLEMPVLRFEIKLPIFVERQWVRHRTCSMNEMSGRYSVMPEEYYVPELDAVRAQSKTNKQGRSEEVLTRYAGKHIDHVATAGESCFKWYKEDIESGVSRELARVQLPLGTYTVKIWQMNLHNLLHFLKLRTDNHAQWEIRQYAKIIEDIVSIQFPWTYSSWKNHIKNSLTFAEDELPILRDFMTNQSSPDTTLSKTRMIEFREKLIRLGLV